ncbi:MAG: DUF2147 domain-containing protein [Deferribacterota bacterium]|nr:DUF2147 domain-containing protein [Deferribacterota bacterium]
MSKKLILKLFIILITFVVSNYLYATDDKSVFGLWKTNNIRTKKPEAIVKIYKKDGKLYGKVVRLLPNRIKELNEMGEYPPLCKKCPGRFKNKPIIGLDFVYGLEKDDDKWEDGKILDPETGKIYNVSIYLNKDNPDILMVKGCIVWPLCKTQKWERVSGSSDNN